MSNVALKELDESLWEQAVAESEKLEQSLRELGEAPVVEVSRRKKRLGFTLEEVTSEPDPQHLARQKSLGSRRQQYERFKASCAAARQRALQAGIEPLAVLPAKAFVAICEAGGLYRFEHLSGKGAVVVENRVPAYAACALGALVTLAVSWFMFCQGGDGVATASPLLALAALAALLAYAPLMIRLGGPGKSTLAWWAFIGYSGLPPALAYLSQPSGLWIGDWLIVSVLPLIVTSAGYALGSWACHSLRKPLTALVLKLAPSWLSCRLFFPGRIDRETTPGRERVELCVNFPDPPPAVQETLKKALRSYRQLHVAAVPGAITLGLSEVLAPVPVVRDPIVYAIDGDTVTILAQFGDFPVERETVRKISSLAFLPG